MSRIRAEQIADATVTIVLVRSCTHRRRHVEWETQARITSEWVDWEIDTFYALKQPLSKRIL